MGMGKQEEKQDRPTKGLLNHKKKGEGRKGS